MRSLFGGRAESPTRPIRERSIVQLENAAGNATCPACGMDRAAEYADLDFRLLRPRTAYMSRIAQTTGNRRIIEVARFISAGCCGAVIVLAQGSGAE